MRQPKSLLAAIAAASLTALLLQGCGTGTASTATATSATVTLPTNSVHGRVHGGQQPISGATIQLYAVNASTAFGASAPLLTATVQTNSNGEFDISTLYSCPTGAQVYLAATGGDPGAGPNSSIALLAGLGPCSALSNGTFIYINEVTTAATVFALAPFIADVAHVGAAHANLQGLVNAFQTQSALANTGAGTAPGPNLPANATAPSAIIYALANVIADCVNSANASTECSALFSATPSSSGPPTDTVQALLNIARSPAQNVSAIYNLITAKSPFQSSLTGPPSDWTVAIKYTGGGLNSPYGIAADASGNLWVANEGAFSVSEFNYLGAAVNTFTGGGLLAPQGIAVDLSGNIWVANAGASSVVKMSSSGTILSGTGGFTSGGIGAATGIAIDNNGNAWVSNFDMDSITELDPNGNALNGSPIAETPGSAPVAVTIDPTGNIWVSNSGTGTVAAFASTGSPASGSPYTDGSLIGGGQLATTSAGNPWVPSTGNSQLSAFSNSGTPLSASPIGGGGLSTPVAVATDGSDTIWVANGATAGTLSAFTASGTALTPSTGLGSLNTPAGIAVDASGNIWTANSGDNSLTEFVGLGAPVVTPLAARVQ